MFDSLSFPDARPIAFLKRAVQVLFVVCFVTAMTSGYRAYYQVYRLDLELTEPVLRGGSVIQTSVVGSGRTPIDVRVELIQDGRARTLAVQRMPDNDWAAFDPRPQRASQTVVLSPEVMAGFPTGAAKVRATATGRPQWLRLPPPLVREAEVEIRQE